MADLKTAPNQDSVGDFIGSVEDNQRRADCKELLELMSEITGERPRMRGSSMVGFGTYHYKYATGREGDWFVVGFYGRDPLAGRYCEQLARLQPGRRKFILFI